MRDISNDEGGRLFERCTAAKYAYAIVDIDSRKWITTLLAAEATSVQVKVLFTQALRSEGVLDDLDQRLEHPELVDVDDETLPVLLAVSDNGTEMTSTTTRAFLATMSVAQHFGRPGTPTDQAWIESLWSHIKSEWPHLNVRRVQVWSSTGAPAAFAFTDSMPLWAEAFEL